MSMDLEILVARRAWSSAPYRRVCRRPTPAAGSACCRATRGS